MGTRASLEPEQKAIVEVHGVIDAIAAGSDFSRSCVIGHKSTSRCSLDGAP